MSRMTSSGLLALNQIECLPAVFRFQDPQPFLREDAP